MTIEYGYSIHTEEKYVETMENVDIAGSHNDDYIEAA